MFVFVMRHGDAVYQQHDDEVRPLSEIGRIESFNSANWLKAFLNKHDSRIEVALVSPFLRAQQTFAQVSQIVPADQVKTYKGIVPGGRGDKAHQYIDSYAIRDKHMKGILVVSHMPVVSYLLDELCGVHLSQIFSTGTIACVDYDTQQGGGKLIDSFTPKTTVS